MPDRTFSESEHEAIVRSTVEREVASAVQDRDSTISELEQKVDVLEAEKAAAEQARDKVQGEFDEFKTKVEDDKAVEARKSERVERVKSAAIHLPDDYFTPERAQRWAAMDDEQFAGVVEAFEDTTLAGLTKEEAQEIKDLEGEAKAEKLKELRARRQEKAGERVRETAAFNGGQSPAAPEDKTAASQFFARRRGVPVGSEQ